MSPGCQFRDVSIRADFSSRLPRLWGPAGGASVKAPATLCQQLVHFKPFNRRNMIVARPQLVAIHLHNEAVHKSLMERPTTKAPVRTGAAFSLALDRDLVHVYGEPAFHYFLDIERA